MAAQKFLNNITTSLDAQLLIGGTSLTVTTGDGALFPLPVIVQTIPEFFLVTLHDAFYTQWEIVSVTTRVGDTFSVIERSFEGSTARQWEIGTLITMNLTKGSLEALQTAVETAQAAADAAQVTADAAGGGGAGKKVIDVEINDGTTYFVDPATGVSVVFRRPWMRVDMGQDSRWDQGGFRGQSTAIVNLGLTEQEFLQNVQVWKNNVLMQSYHATANDDNAWDTAAFAGYVQWGGHMWLYFADDLVTGDYIQIVAPEAANWESPNKQADFAWQAGGITNFDATPANSPDLNWKKIDFAVHTRKIITADLGLTGYRGMGGTSDSVDGRVFGGTGRLNDWDKLLISTEANTHFVNGLSSNMASSGGCAATNGTISVLAGCSPLTVNMIVTHSTNVVANNANTITSSPSSAASSCVSNVAQTFAYQFVGSTTAYRKFTYSTEVWSDETFVVTAESSFQVSNHAFYDNHAWQYDEDQHNDFNMDTEVNSLYLAFGAIDSVSNSYHGAVCDGGTYIIGQFFTIVYPSAAYINKILYDETDADGTAFQGIGCFSDTWECSE